MNKTQASKEAHADPQAYLDERFSVAVHEAGHAVAFHKLFGKASEVRIYPWGHGATIYAGWARFRYTAPEKAAFAWCPKRGNPASGIAQRAKELRQMDMLVSTAGYAAQAIYHRTSLVFGRDDRSNGDARCRRKNIRVLQALGEIRPEAELVREVEARTLVLLRRRWAKVRQLAVALDEVLHLSAKQVWAILT